MRKDGQQYGPYNLGQLKNYVKHGNFSTADLACYDGQNWIQVSQVPGLIKTKQHRPTAPPIPPKTNARPRKKRTFLSGCLILFFLCMILGAISGTCSNGSDLASGEDDNEEIQNTKPSYKTRPQEKRWFEYGDLHSADLAQWRVAPQRNKIATAADWLASTKWKGHLNSPNDFEVLKVQAKKLSDAIDISAFDPNLGFIKAVDVADGIITLANDLGP